MNTIHDGTVGAIDTIVIGAGLGGLAAGVALAGAGQRVIVLEQGAVPGGYAQCFQQGPYRFEVSLHALDAMAPGGGNDALLRTLGVADRLRLRRLDPLYLLRGSAGDLIVPADLFRYESILIGLFPGEAAGLRAYVDEVLAVYHDVRRRREDGDAGRAPSDPGEFVTRYPAMARLGDQTWEQLMARHVGVREAREILGALWVYAGLPPSRCSALVGALLTGGYHEHGGWYLEGGSGALSQALADVLVQRGGQIQYAQRVTSIEVDGDRAVAVHTADGRRLPARQIVSNASAPTTMLEMVGRDLLPAEYAELVSRPSPSYTTFSVFLGLGRDVIGEAGLPHEVFVGSGEGADEQWEASLRGDVDRVGFGITDYTRVDPGCAPAGHGTLVLGCVLGWDVENTWGTGGDLAGYQQNSKYLAIKEKMADVLIARADAVVPGLAQAIRFREAATPLTNARYTLNPRGAIEGYENSPENTGAGWLPQQTPIRNLVLAGAWTTVGGMTAVMASGLNAARILVQSTPAA